MTDKVRLYVVRNDDGEYLMDPAFAAWFPDWTDDIITADLYEHKEEAEETANKCDSHVVPLVEAPPKVVVSEKEADILKRVATEQYPASFIMGAVASNDALYADKESEDRLMRAYVNGYTVAKENNYYVKVPHTKEAWYYKSGDTDLLTICPADKKLRGKFTESEIEQYGLQDCEKVWCDSDD